MYIYIYVYIVIIMIYHLDTIGCRMGGLGRERGLYHKNEYMSREAISKREMSGSCQADLSRRACSPTLRWRAVPCK